MEIRVQKSFHSRLIRAEIKRAWKENILLILLPPGVETCGDLDLIRSTHLPEKPIFGIYSSGTVGRKLVLYSKTNIESSLAGILSLFDSKKINQLFCYPQPYHTFGLILGYCQSFLYGRELVALDGPYSEGHHARWRETLISSQMTLGTPTHFKDLLSYLKKENLTPLSSYTSIIGAARVEKKLWKDMQEKLSIQFPSIGYGATEASPGITHLPPGQAPLEDGEVGYVLPHVKMHTHAHGFDFEGPNVCLATIEKEKITFPNQISISDHLETRDDGVLLYRGRSSLTLNRGGEKFSLESIEGLIKDRLGIESICTTIPDSRLGEELGVLACANIEYKGKVFTLLRETFGREFNSDHFLVTDTLPLNANSKLDRQSARGRFHHD